MKKNCNVCKAKLPSNVLSLGMTVFQSSTFLAYNNFGLSIDVAPSTSAADLVISHYEVPDDISIGVPFDVVFDVTNDGSSFQDESNARYFDRTRRQDRIS